MPNREAATVRDSRSRKQSTARASVIAMPATQAAERKPKRAPSKLPVTMPALIASAGARFLRCGGNIDRFREWGGQRLTRTQATNLLLRCLCEALYGDVRKAA